MSEFFWVRAVFLSCVGAAMFSRSPCFHVFFIDDALAFMHFWSAIFQGEESPVTVLIAMGQGHAHPLWTLQFGMQVALFGLDPVPWHVANSLYHAGSAFLLYMCMRSFLVSRAGAATAAVAWSAAVVGGYDEPASTIFEGHYSVSLFWLLAAVWAGRRRVGASRFQRVLPWVFAAFAILSWNVTILGLPMLASNAFIPGGKPMDGRGKNGGVRFSVVFGAILLGLVAVLLWLGGGSPPWVWPVLIAWQFAETLARLVWYGPTQTPEVGFALALLVLALLGLLLGGGRRLRIAMLFASYPFLVNLAIVATRPLDSLSAGDYLHLPAFFWCVVAGLLFDDLAARRAMRWRNALAIGVVGLIFFVAHQRSSAVQTVAHSTQRMEVAARQFEATEVLWTSLERRAEHEQRRWRLPNVLVPLQRGLPFTFSVSTLVPLLGNDVVPRIDIVPVAEWTDEDQSRLERELEAVGGPAARYWTRLVATLVPEMKALNDLDKRIADRGQRVVLPSDMVVYPELQVATDLHLLHGLSVPEGGGIQFVPADSAVTADGLEILDREAGTDPATAKAWKRLADRSLRRGKSVLEGMAEWRAFLESMEWRLNFGEGYSARLLPSADPHEIAVERILLPGDVPWGVVLSRGHFSVVEGRVYRLAFRAKARAPRSLVVGFHSLSPPARFVHSPLQARLDAEWAEYSFDIVPEATGDVTISFNVGGSEIPFAIGDLGVWDGDARIDDTFPPQ